MSKTKSTLIGIALFSCLIALVYPLFYTTAEVPAFLAKASHPQKALILRPIRPSALKPGDLILVEMKRNDASIRIIRKLEKIVQPEKSERQIAGKSIRYPGSHLIAQAILDMDFKPTYRISSDNKNDPATTISIEESQIKGKVIHMFGR